ncbi:Uu.00g050630.m01.CDS01 [Anthostomella pinea]|uniref:Uu.00g050630.m01.CDS01 n=1 Tax=Anthostomella pinea TaxID=933095 RepID=A0AAI8VM39_9PEZI|nr:Uu.00g050630.m01.CDS01 [Anthostomella pinea]
MIAQGFRAKYGQQIAWDRRWMYSRQRTVDLKSPSVPEGPVPRRIPRFRKKRAVQRGVRGVIRVYVNPTSPVIPIVVNPTPPPQETDTETLYTPNSMTFAKLQDQIDRTLAKTEAVYSLPAAFLQKEIDNALARATGASTPADKPTPEDKSTPEDKTSTPAPTSMPDADLQAQIDTTVAQATSKSKYTFELEAEIDNGVARATTPPPAAQDPAFKTLPPSNRKPGVNAQGKTAAQVLEAMNDKIAEEQKNNGKVTIPLAPKPAIDTTLSGAEQMAQAKALHQKMIRNNEADKAAAAARAAAGVPTKPAGTPANAGTGMTTVKSNVKGILEAAGVSLNPNTAAPDANGANSGVNTTGPDPAAAAAAATGSTPTGVPNTTPASSVPATKPNPFAKPPLLPGSKTTGAASTTPSSGPKTLGPFAKPPVPPSPQPQPGSAPSTTTPTTNPAPDLFGTKPPPTTTSIFPGTTPASNPSSGSLSGTQPAPTVTSILSGTTADPNTATSNPELPASTKTPSWWDTNFKPSGTGWAGWSSKDAAKPPTALPDGGISVSSTTTPTTTTADSSNTTADPQTPTSNPDTAATNPKPAASGWAGWSALNATKLPPPSGDAGMFVSSTTTTPTTTTTTAAAAPSTKAKNPFDISTSLDSSESSSPDTSRSTSPGSTGGTKRPAPDQSIDSELANNGKGKPTSTKRVKTVQWGAEVVSPRPSAHPLNSPALYHPSGKPKKLRPKKNPNPDQDQDQDPAPKKDDDDNGGSRGLFGLW